MPLRLQSGGAYTSDISALRAQIRANGTRPNLSIITISHPLAQHTVDLYINLAYEPNSNLPPINASLYTVAFGNANGIWNFAIGNIGGVAVPGVAFPGNLNGSYASLGYAVGLPNITDANLAAAIGAVATYPGTAPVPQPVLDGMARLIIAVSEAVRFDAIESDINGVLGNGNNYAPPAGTIRSWGGHTLGS